MSVEIPFYLAAVVAIVASLKVITRQNPIHALLYLVVSLLAVAVCFYLMGAPLAAAPGNRLCSPPPENRLFRGQPRWVVRAGMAAHVGT